MGNKKRYNCWFCSCGRIHVMDYEVYEWLKKDCEHRRVVRVCQNCGRSTVTWLQDYCYGSLEICGNDFTDQEVIPGGEYEYRFILNRGIKVPMVSGWYANSYHGNTYVDWDYIQTYYGNSDLSEVEKKNPGVTQVDVETLIREVKDDDILRSIAGYVSGIDWTGTKYER